MVVADGQQHAEARLPRWAVSFHVGEMETVRNRLRLRNQNRNQLGGVSAACADVTLCFAWLSPRGLAVRPGFLQSPRIRTHRIAEDMETISTLCQVSGGELVVREVPCWMTRRTPDSAKSAADRSWASAHFLAFITLRDEGERVDERF